MRLRQFTQLQIGFAGSSMALISCRFRRSGDFQRKSIYASRRHKNCFMPGTQRFGMIGEGRDRAPPSSPARQQQTPGYLTKIVQTRPQQPAVALRHFIRLALPPRRGLPCASAAPEKSALPPSTKRDRQRQRFLPIPACAHPRHLRRAKTTNANSHFPV